MFSNGNAFIDSRMLRERCESATTTILMFHLLLIAWDGECTPHVNAKNISFTVSNFIWQTFRYKYFGANSCQNVHGEVFVTVSISCGKVLIVTAICRISVLKGFIGL